MLSALPEDLKSCSPTRSYHDPKRQRNPSLTGVNDTPATKKQHKRNYQTPWTPSTHFWDTLPKIHLTRRALIENDRRNRQEGTESLTGQEFRPRPQCPDLQQSSFLCPTQERAPSPGLKLFASNGGPDLTTLRGFPDPTMRSRNSQPRRATNTSDGTASILMLRATTSRRRTSSYDKNYELKLGHAGISVTEHVDENDNTILPANYEAIASRLNVSRSSLSPSPFPEEDFQRFRRQTRREVNETGAMSKSMALIEGSGAGIFSLSGEVPCNYLESFDPELAIAKPDSYDRAPPLFIDRRVLNDLDRYIVPNTDASRPAVPNFYLEGKSKQGRADVAQLQAAHTGAIVARAMMSLRSYPSQSLTYDSNAYAFTSTYHDGQLKIYTSHATAPKTAEQRAQYHMTQVDAFAMTHNSKTFHVGATQYRNARDLAKEQRGSAIHQANETARWLPTGNHSHRHRATTMATNPSKRTRIQSEEPESSSDTDPLPNDQAFGAAVKRSRYIAFDKDEDDDLIRMSSMTVMPTIERDKTVQRTSEPASKRRKIENLRVSTS